jgi:hypothetical protein
VKKILLIYCFSILSCSSKNEATIEMMSYNYEMDNSIRYVHSYLYTLVDENGVSKNIKEIDSINTINYSAQLDKKLIEQIISETQTKKESFYKIERNLLGCYLGPIFRFKIKYESGKQMSFIFRDGIYEKDSKYFLFKLLYNQIIEPKQVEDLYKKEAKALTANFEKYKAFVYNKDTLELPLPPPPPPTPKINEVKFVQ